MRTSSSTRSNGCCRRSSSASRAVLGEDDGVSLLLEPAREQEPVDPVVVGDEDRAGGGSARVHAGDSERSAERASLERAVLLLDPVDELRRRRRARRPSRAARASGTAPRTPAAPSVAPFDFSVCAARRSSSASCSSSERRRVAISAGASARKASITSPRNSSPPRSRRFPSAPSSRLTYRDRGRTAVAVRERLHALQRGCELLGADRLRDVVVHPGGEARLAVLGHRVRRHRDDAAGGSPPASARRSGAWRRGRRAPASGRP